MSDDLRKELESLEDGLSSEFWRRFHEHVTREWGPAGLRYQQAVRNAAESANAVVELQKVLYAQEAILGLMQWPRERFQSVRAQALPQIGAPSRRGPGL